MNAPLLNHAPLAKAIAPPTLEAVNLSKRFGDLVALDDVSLRIPPGDFHALLGENGAGKSTLAKCIMGYYQPDSGSIMVNQREVALRSTRDAQALGIGMVYQHFTLVENMTVAENLVLCRSDVPLHIRWRHQLAQLHAFLERMPFKVRLDAYVRDLSAGEKQKTEILKQLYLNNRLLILDEPTSVLTRQEADEILGLIRGMTQAGELSVILITHKFREVERYTDNVTVLRRGKRVGQSASLDIGRDELARWMLGEQNAAPAAPEARTARGDVVLEVDGLSVADGAGRTAVQELTFRLHAGEILGVAGVSGNGQRQLVEALAGQRAALAGEVRAHGKLFYPTRAAMGQARLYCLPEEPLRNASVAELSVAANLALRDFDQAPFQRAGFISHDALHARASELVARYGIKTDGTSAPLRSLSGGNVQRTVLARELSNDARILVVANPCFGLDFRATAQIRTQLAEARNRGLAILLISEDLDEIMELADRVVVMSGGRFNYESPAGAVDMVELGRAMAGR